MMNRAGLFVALVQITRIGGEDGEMLVREREPTSERAGCGCPSGVVVVRRFTAVTP